MASTLCEPVQIAAAARLEAMGPLGRRLAYEAGQLTIHELHVWAALCPEEVPLVNGELPWIVATLADLD